MMKNKLIGLIVLVLFTGCATQLLPTEVKNLPTRTPTVTLSPSATPTPLPTATPTPTPTPIPSEVLSQADAAYKVGDWARAKSLYGRLLPLSSISQDEANRAMLGYGKSLLAEGAVTDAIEVLQGFVQGQPQGGDVSLAQVYLADALMQVDNPTAAIEHYAAVRQAYPILAPYTGLWLGDAYFASGDYDKALETYQSALEEAADNADRVFTLEKIALTHAASNSYEPAMAAYDAILDIAQIEAYRGRIMYQASQTAMAFGETDEAMRRMQTIIELYPTQNYAYQALVQLVEAGVPVDDTLRGLIDYHAEAYGPAVEAFYRVIQADPAHSGEPHYYIGLSYLEAGSYQLALDAFQVLIDTHPDDAYWGSAWIGKGRALAALGRTREAVQAYQALAAELPDHFRASEALWKAADLLEEEGKFVEAADAYESVSERYPDDSGAPAARFRAGLLRYRAGDTSGAQTSWQALVSWYPYDERGQAALFWLGKTYLQAGEQISATQALSRAVGLGAWDYYGLRAAQVMDGRAPYELHTPQINICGSQEEQRVAEDWLVGWLDGELEPSPGAEGHDLSTLPANLLNDARLRKGTLLLRLGHFDEGRVELEALREATTGDALAQYQLAHYYRDVGLYRSSIIAAATVWRLSPAMEIHELPRYLGCLIYPTYFSDLVLPEANAQGFDPLVIYALLRQESLFEGFATSYAAAHGLMQVIPSTGAQIARALDWPSDYQTSDLYRPMVSVRFGVWYLAQQRDALDSNLFAGMAAYNGGPGNAARWWEAAGKDPDLFVELVGFQETRTYIKRILEHFAKYRWLYRGE